MDRAPVFGTGCWGFESLLDRHFYAAAGRRRPAKFVSFEQYVVCSCKNSPRRMCLPWCVALDQEMACFFIHVQCELSIGVLRSAYVRRYER